jgi:signal transduction histidine kinase
MKIDAYRFIDWFIPAPVRATESDRLMARTFVLLHFLGPLMGHSVTFFLWRTPAGVTWQFWCIEAMLLSFFCIPLLLRATRTMLPAAMASVQILVALSLFGSFFFGGISSPFLPWFLIAMVLGLFYLSESLKPVLIGVACQLASFFGVRLFVGNFPTILPLESLKYATLLSIVAALAYMTMLTLYYELVMRISVRIEQEAIEQRNKLIDLREAMEAAELASKRKSIFLAKMSHELRTPLNAVIGYTEMLRETFEEQPGSTRKMEDLDRIHTAGRHLLALVDDVIDLNSIEANRIELVLEPVRVASLVDDVISTASPLIRKRDNRMVVNMPEDLGMIELDALKLRQSLLNLLSNAAKFTSKGLVILTVLAKATDKGEVMVLEVTDNGIGISQEGLDRLFSNFSQAEADTSSKFGGTGLGLALTRRLCEMMGGAISVRSERGVGTSFTIEIPIKRATAQLIDAASAGVPVVAEAA